MSETDEIKRRIDECITEMKPFTYFSHDAEVAIKSFEELKRTIENIDKKDVPSIIRGLEEGYEKSLAYSSLVPKTVENLRFIIEWLKRKAEEKVSKQ